MMESANLIGLNVSNFNSGIYLIRITDENANQIFTQKIIKQ